MSETIRALVVENPRSSPSLAAQVARFANELARVASFEEAHAFVRSTAVDLVVVDLEVDGPAALRALVADPDACASTYVVVSGGVTPHEAFGMGQLGVRAFVPKPIEPDAFHDVLRTALERAPDITPHIRAAVGLVPIHEIERTARRTMMTEALRRARGSKTEAARLLRVSRQLLQHMVRGQKRLS